MCVAFLEAAGAVSKIVSSLKSNHQVKIIVKIPEGLPSGLR
jgi:hypothetical protein